MSESATFFILHWWCMQWLYFWIQFQFKFQFLVRNALKLELNFTELFIKNAFQFGIYLKFLRREGNQNENEKGNYFVACSGLFKLENRPAWSLHCSLLRKKFCRISKMVALEIDATISYYISNVYGKKWKRTNNKE